MKISPPARAYIEAHGIHANLRHMADYLNIAEYTAHNYLKLYRAEQRHAAAVAAGLEDPARQCLRCRRVFGSANARSNHERACTGNTAIAPVRAQEPPRLTCEHCDDEFPSASIRASHERACAGDAVRKARIAVLASMSPVEQAAAECDALAAQIAAAPTWQQRRLRRAWLRQRWEMIELQQMLETTTPQ